MAEFSSLNGFMVKDTTARNIAKGRNQAVAFSDYATMIETLNATEKDEYRMGQNFYIGTVGVPDLWVYSVEDIAHNFNYISDEDMVEKLKNNTTIQAGYYKLAMLEGQKVDLTTYDEKLADHSSKLTAHGVLINNNKSAISTANTNMGKIRTYVGSDGKLHFTDASGADSVLPFNNKAKLILLGASNSFNISSVVGAENIGKYTKDDFICIPNFTSMQSLPQAISGGIDDIYNVVHVLGKTNDFSVTYNASTGAVSVTNMTLTTTARLHVQSGAIANTTSVSYSIPPKVYLCVRTGDKVS